MSGRSGGNRLTQRIFFSYAVTLTIPLLIMCIFSYFWMGGIIRQQTEEVYVDNLQNVRAELEKRFADLDNFSNTIAATQWAQVLIFMPGPNIDLDRMDPITLNNHLSELGNYRSMNGFIENLAIYMFNTQRVIYPDGVDLFDWFFYRTYAFEKMAPTDWQAKVDQIKDENTSMFIGPLPVYKYFSYDQIMIYMRTLPMRVGQPQAAIFFMIRLDTLRSVLGKVATSDNSSVYLFNEQNQLIAATDSDSDTQARVSELLSGKQNNLPASLRDETGNIYDLFSVQGTGRTAGWHYVALYPEVDILDKVQFIKNLTLLLSGFLLTVGILLSYSVARRSYRPVKKLASLVLDSLKPVKTNESSDFELIEKGIREAMRKQAEMQEHLDKYQSVLLRDLMEKLLNGRQKALTAEDRQELERHGFSATDFTVAIISGSAQLPETIFPTNELSIFTLPREDQQVLIINSQDRQAVIAALKTLQKSRGPAEADGETQPTIGAGMPYPAEDLYQSYNEAHFALDYELLKGRGALICFDEVDLSLDKFYYYPVFWDKRFIEGLNSQDGLLIRTYLDRGLKYYISQSNMTLSVERLLFYKRALLEMQKMSDQALNEVIRKTRNDFLAAGNQDDMQMGIENLLKAICQSAIRQKETYSQEQIGSILQYIEEHYTDSSLSLNALADHYGMSSPRMSLFFKEKTGENFIDFLLKKRVQVAKSLLMQSSLTVEEIGVQVGFDSVHTFRRAFKKYEILTPGQYRGMGQ